jgi:hypothetical protein
LNYTPPALAHPISSKVRKIQQVQQNALLEELAEGGVMK